VAKEAAKATAKGPGTREFRMEELAREAGITVRTLRFYRERKLIPPPRREGRIAWYDESHLARLRTIAALLERGHTLSGIAELSEAFDRGRDVGELLGLGEPSEETPVRLTPEELADYFAGQVTPDNLEAAMDLGYVGVDGEEIVHVSRRLLDVSAALVARASRSPTSSRPPNASAPTRRTWPNSSPTWSSPTHRNRTSSACARSPRAWSRRNCPWPWTAPWPENQRSRQPSAYLGNHQRAL
jgi:DNA-binding transcriptional MerR regulator